MTPAELAARLIAEFCIPAITNSEQGRAPVEGVEVAEHVRLQLGLAPYGRTVRYALPDAAVYLDMRESQTQVFFNHPTAGDVPPRLEPLLRERFPGAERADSETAPGMMLRLYNVRLSPERIAVVELLYPAPGAQSRDFAARITALVREGALKPAN